MTAVESAIAEINACLALFAPQHEGLRDFARLNLGDAAMRVVRAQIANYDRRVSLLIAAKEACTDLMGDGHPDIAVMETTPDALADLQDNVKTVTAAISKFVVPAAASSFDIATGTIVPKSA